MAMKSITKILNEQTKEIRRIVDDIRSMPPLSDLSNLLSSTVNSSTRGNSMATSKQLKPGEVLEVVADDKGIKLDMPAWCKATRQEYLGTEEANGEYHSFVKKAS